MFFGFIVDTQKVLRLFSCILLNLMFKLVNGLWLYKRGKILPAFMSLEFTVEAAL